MIAVTAAAVVQVVWGLWSDGMEDLPSNLGLFALGVLVGAVTTGLYFLAGGARGVILPVVGALFFLGCLAAEVVFLKGWLREGLLPGALLVWYPHCWDAVGVARDERAASTARPSGSADPSTSPSRSSASTSP